MKKFKLLSKITPILILFIVSIFNLSFIQDEQIVSGTVYHSENGKPIPGVLVSLVEPPRIKMPGGVMVYPINTPINTLTDHNGYYSLAIPADYKQIQFKYTGMITVEENIESENIIDIYLKPNILGSDDVVVYGKRRPFKIKTFAAIKPINKINFNLDKNTAFEWFNTDNGLVTDRIFKIHEDNEGYIWIATDEGLLKYNGYEFHTYLPEPFNDNSLKYKKVTDIFEDSKGNLWLSVGGFRNGLNRFNPRKNKWDYYSSDYRDTLSLSHNRINIIYETSDGSVWVGTSDGLNKFNESKNTFSQYLNTSSSGTIINCMAEDKKGRLWIGTSEGLAFYSKTENKILKYQLKSIANINEYNDYKINPIYNIYLDKSENLWFGGFGGVLNKLINQDPYKSKTYFVKGAIGDIIEDDSSNLWIAAHSKLFKYDQKKDTIIEITDIEVPSNSFYSNSIESLILGVNNQIYIVFRQGFDILILDENGNIDSNQNYLRNLFDNYSNMITDAIVDNSNNIWIGTISNGILKYSPYNLLFKGYVIPEEFRELGDGFIMDLEDVMITDFFKDDQSRTWIGTDQGLFVMDSARQQFKQLIEKNINVKKILGTVGSDLYVATVNSLLIYNMELDQQKSLSIDSLDLYTFKEEGENWFVSYDKLFKGSKNLEILINEIKNRNLDINYFSFEEDNNKLFWCQCGDLLFMFDPKTGIIQNYNYNSNDSIGLSGNISKILLDYKGKIWTITTQGNLSEFYYSGEEANSGHFLHHLLPIEQTGGKVYSILSEENKFWISTVNGLLLYEPNVGIIRRFNKADGYPQINKAFTSYIAPDGEIFFGGKNYFFSFYSDKLLYNYNQPRMVITDLYIDNQKVEIGEHSTLNKALSNTEIIELSHKESKIGFKYVALEYSEPSKNNYAYRLIGLDTNWIETGTIRTAFFPNLDPGDYIFEVKGSNNHGIWSDEPARVRISIHPPWYQRSLAYISYCVLFFTILFGFIRWRTWSLKKDKKVLESQVKERTKQIEHQKQEIESQRDVVIRQKEKVENTLEQLKQTQNQLIQSEKLASLGGLVAGVAHEINTPVGIGVTAISNLIEETKHMADLYNKEQISRKDFKEFLQTTNNTARLVQRNLERTAELVQSFKQVSVDQSTEEQRKFFLKAYLEDVIRSLYPKFKNRDIQVNVECDNKLEIKSYPGAFAQIFTNLLLNSIAHGFSDEVGGQVEILVSQDNNELSINYMDNGKGIPEDILPKIFDPFFTTDQSKGTGLGLNIVYNLVTQKLNGTIVCDSRINNGVEFKIKIPKDS